MAKGNQYVQHWTLEEASKFFEEAYKLSLDRDYDFIGEIARDLKQYIDLFDYLTGKFPQLIEIKERIKNNCAANCFSNGKRGDIVPSMAIMNLKSNHGWTDRVDNTTKGEKVEYTPLSFFRTDDSNK